ncbi:OmpA family protein [Chryseobacterium turcicum]|uniref:OmpA family protein n=1 Tax=Chryseobacterium turcicum TaxID=2898076 RepID=A0A9Q3V763_9FLAO|nr:OmpA family protein [Chryseobacterium turcicum]MCD1118639.1 OmpA family protein [Chryseobacterium turcicum]
MSKGIKKIKFVPQPNEANNSNSRVSADKWVIVPANKKAHFYIKEWHADTTEAQKKGHLYWMVLDKDRKKIIDRIQYMTDKYFSYKIPKRLCGYPYYVEASMTGKPDIQFTGLVLLANCPPLIISSIWSRTRGGKNVKNTEDNNFGFCYGEEIHFHADTEGINGEVVVVEVYNEMWNGNYKMRTLYNVTVTDGQINLKIPNTSEWKSSIKFIQDNEEFYVKIKRKNGGYLRDKDGVTEHGKYLNIKNELKVVNKTKPSNQSTILVGSTEKNHQGVGLCKFKQIVITDDKNISIFEEGKTKLKRKAHTSYNEIVETIHFDFNKNNIRADDRKTLDVIASKLKNNKHSNVIIEGHADERGPGDFNLRLSQNRSEAVAQYLKQQGLSSTKFLPHGLGENQLIYKGTDLTEKQHEENRRAKIRFSVIDHDELSLIYEVIAPPYDSTNKKKINIQVNNFENKGCIGSHEKNIIITDIGQVKNGNEKVESFPVPSKQYEVYSDLSVFNAFPIQYIWPASTTPNKTNIHIHSCTYFANKNIPTVIVKTYPDVKWTLELFFNLTNDLGVKWQNLDPHEHKEWQKKAGKMGAEKRWKQKDASLGFSLKAKWDNDRRENEFKYEYETKIKKLYEIFSSIGAIADGITSQTKGCSPTGIPMTFAVKPPNINFTGDWYLAHPKNNNQVLGTHVDLHLIAKPLIGLEVTIDLLGTAVFVGSQIVGAGPGVTELYKRIQGKLKKGVKFGNDDVAFKANIDIYMDLVVTQTINLDTHLIFNTEEEIKDSKLKVEGSSRLKVELKVGVKIRGELSVVVLTVSAYFEASASGDASITFGHTINYADDKGGLYYRPILGFDGLNAKYLVEVSAGLAIKIVKDKHAVEDNEKYTLAEGNYPNVIPPFDVVKELEKLFGINANIPLIKNDK